MDGGEDACRPFSYCTWDTTARKCNDKQGQSSASDEVCRWAVAGLDCPKGGCFGIGFRLPKEFGTDPPTDPRPSADCFPKSPDWDVSLAKRSVGRSLAGDCADAPILQPDFCTTPVKQTR